LIDAGLLGEIAITVAVVLVVVKVVQLIEAPHDRDRDDRG
jgi:hypothetical protein